VAFLPVHGTEAIHWFSKSNHRRLAITTIDDMDLVTDDIALLP